MSKKNIYLIIILILIIISSLVVFLIYSKLNDNPEIIQKQSKEKIIEQEDSVVKDTEEAPVKKKKNIKYPLDLAKEKSDVKECLKIEDEKYRDICVTLLAESLQSTNLCLNIQKEEFQKNCMDKTSYKKAVLNSEFGVCSQINSEVLKQACIINILSEKKDATEGDCSALGEKEKEYCIKYLSFARNRVIFNTAKSESECEQINDESVKLQCISRL